MGDKNRNGVDGAIALLSALAESGGDASTSGLEQTTGLPRASLHRIAVTLEQQGIVARTHGRTRVGPVAGELIARRRKQFDKEHTRRIVQTKPGRGVVPTHMQDATLPLALSAPRVKRPRRRFHFGFSNASLSNPWRTALVHSIEYGAARLGKAVERLSVRHAGDNAQMQCSHIKELVEGGIDGLIVSTAGTHQVDRAISEAIAAGVTVVFVDRGPASDIGQSSFVTSSDEIIGRTTALWLSEILNGTGRILLLPGEPDAEPARLRLAAAQQVYDTQPGIEIVGTKWTDWNAVRAREITAEILKHQRIDGVWCDSGQHGIGALQAFIDAGFGHGEIPPHTGGDLNGAYKMAIRHKVPLGAVDYPPSMGMTAVETLHAALNGYWVPKRLDMQSDVILTRGHATASVKPTLWAEDHVRWDLPNDLILHAGLGEGYSPRSFRINYPGNSYNRSTAQLAKTVQP